MTLLRYSLPVFFLGGLSIGAAAQGDGRFDDHMTCRTNDLELLAPLHQGRADRLAEIAANDAALEMETAIFTANHSDTERGGGNYVLPVVFHIIHNGGPENISDEQVKDAVRILNDDYNKLNTDWDDVQSEFLPIVADVGITFRLAQKDPDGNCTSGITRTQSVLTNDGTQDMKDLIQWPRDMYLNIWVAASADGAAGYTMTPGAVSSPWSAPADGIVVLHDYTGSIGTSSLSHSRVLTHEVGHWINLRHCWGPTNEPGLASNCGESDNVSDTPPTQGWTACVLSGATCGSFLDNVENYMEYSYCCKMFTNGQKTRMLAALNSSTADRDELWQPSNLAATGTTGTDLLCAADFSSDMTVVCSGGQVTFNDMSYHGATSWAWTFDGGTPASSTDENPVVTYDTPGQHAVTLIASNGIDDVTLTRSAYVTVLPAPGQPTPLTENFDDLTALPPAEWLVNDLDGDEAFELFTTAGYSGTHSVRLRNYGSEAGDLDELVTTTIDLSDATICTLSFRYAFARRNADNDDALRVYASSNCGETWSMRKQFTAATTLPTVADQSSQFTPDDPADWEYAEVTNINSPFLTEDFRLKFWFTSGGGNNFYIDDINLNGAPVGIEEVLEGNGLAVVPNPVEDVADLVVNSSDASTARIEMLDVLGRVISTVHQGGLGAGRQRIPLPLAGLESGVYFIRMERAGTTSTVRFTVR